MKSSAVMKLACLKSKPMGVIDDTLAFVPGIMILHSNPFSRTNSRTLRLCRSVLQFQSSHDNLPVKTSSTHFLLCFPAFDFGWPDRGLE